jgi:hypothetical protein
MRRRKMRNLSVVSAIVLVAMLSTVSTPAVEAEFVRGPVRYDKEERA